MGRAHPAGRRDQAGALRGRHQPPRHVALEGLDALRRDSLGD
jgi:hypothetical protein